MTDLKMPREPWRSRIAAMLDEEPDEKIRLYETASDEELADRLRRDPVRHAMWRRKFPGAYPE